MGSKGIVKIWCFGAWLFFKFHNLGNFLKKKRHCLSRGGSIPLTESYKFSFLNDFPDKISTGIAFSWRKKGHCRSGFAELIILDFAGWPFVEVQYCRRWSKSTGSVSWGKAISGRKPFYGCSILHSVTLPQYLTTNVLLTRTNSPPYYWRALFRSQLSLALWSNTTLLLEFLFWNFSGVSHSINGQ